MEKSLLRVVLVVLTFALVGCPEPILYTVTYDGNGNTGGSVPVDGTSYPEGDTVTVLRNTGNLVKTDYAFTGWNTKDDGSGDGYAAGETFVMGATDVTLYAVWTIPQISTVAGTGSAGYSGDGGPATSAQLNQPYGVAVDSQGNLYIGDQWNHRVRKVTPSGTITTVAGTGTAGYSGDGGPATDAQLNWPYGVAVDSADNLYIADYENDRVRKVDASSGTITTVASGLSGPCAMAFDADGNCYIAEFANPRVSKLSTSGIVTAFAGTGFGGSPVDGVSATSSPVAAPAGLAVDADGNVYIASADANRIRKVDTSGIISTCVGPGTAGTLGDGGLATAADLGTPYGVAVDASGNLYIAGTMGNRIRKVDTSGIITTVAGTGTGGSSGDGGAAASAQLSGPMGVICDLNGDLYIADFYNSRIRKVSPL